MRTLADAKALDQMCDRLASTIDRQMQAGGAGGWALIGLRSGGDRLARRLADHLDAEKLQGRVGSLDITLYRDDLSAVGPQAVVRTTEVPFALDGLNVVLVDDVMMTGRSVRAALSSLMDLGRPRRVWLAVLVDRGGRELPIAPDFVGLDLPQLDAELTENDQVQVHLEPDKAHDAIVVESEPTTTNANG